MDEETKLSIQKLKEATQKSKCTLCGAESYGKGCIYSPRGIHLHIDDNTRCSWCGSKTIYGKGCIYSPTGLHGFGANLFTSMISETFISAWFLKKLKTPFIEYKAYEKGLINENGTLIKKPVTKDEKRSYNIVDSFIFKLKRFLGEKIDLINENLFLEATNNTINENVSVEDFEKELKLKRKLDLLAKDFNSTIIEARINNLPEETIEKIILESFLK
jgi:hypothetical protein